jgi:glycosyltransferase involved in cell wall biosynthesis
MKILLVHNAYQQPGGEDVVFQLERDMLRAAGHEVLEYRRFNDEIKDYSIVRKIALLGRTVWASDSYRDLTHLLQQHRPAIVHLHNAFPLISPSAFWACRNENIPVVQTLHNYRLMCPGGNFCRDGKPCEDCITGKFWQGAVHACYRNSRAETAAVALMLTVHHSRKTWTEMVDSYIVLTAFSKSRYVAGGFPEEKMRVKPNFVDPDPGQRTSRGTYALFAGRLDPEKGIPTLLKAWLQMPHSHTLRILGDGVCRPETEAFAKVYPNVEFLGWLPHNQVFDQIKGARFVVFPSEWYENLPLVIIEAFACGVPVIASALGAMNEVVEHGRTGLLFRPGDVDDLARTMALAWQQPEYLDRIAENARAEYEAKYTAAANYRQLMRIYLEVIAKRSSPVGNQPQNNNKNVEAVELPAVGAPRP